MSENIRSVDRALDLLELLALAPEPMNLSEICKKTNLSKSTVFRILGTLAERCYAEKRPDGTYSLGYKLIEIASSHINGLELLTESKPFLNEIARDLELTSHMGILDGKDVVYIEKLDMYPNTRLYTQVGYRSPAFCSSIGKCLMAGLSGEELDALLFGMDFHRYTKNTISGKTELKKELRKIRQQGWAMDDEEFKIGHRCIGAPVFDYRGASVAAISISGSASILTDDKIPEVVSRLKQAAAEISRRMGYTQ